MKNFIQKIFGSKNQNERAIEILSEVSKKHFILPVFILGESRLTEFVKARSELAWRLRKELLMSYPAIGTFLDRDHSSIMHLVQKYDLSNKKK